MSEIIYRKLQKIILGIRAELDSIIYNLVELSSREANAILFKNIFIGI